MSELKFIQGQKVSITERIDEHGRLGWEHKSRESDGIYISCNSEGAFVQMVQGDRLRLYQVPFNDIYIKLENN